jgi:fatty-acyl-CoA synthase
MAALLLRERGAFDGRAFFTWTSERLPGYAAPLFVRLVREPDLTSTFKLRKLDLQRAGYSPARCAGDPLYVRDEPARRYSPLTPAALARLSIPPSA